MKTATLDSPKTLDPTQYVGVRLISATMLFSNNGLQVSYELIDANGKPVARKTVNVSTAQSQTYVGNQETTLLNALLSRLGFSGTVS